MTDTLKEELKKLMDEKDKIESELKELQEVLETVSCIVVIQSALLSPM